MVNRKQNYERPVVGGKGVHIDSYVVLCGPKSPRRMLGIPVDGTSFAGIVPVEDVREEVMYPTRGQGKRKTG
jgi:hypothetical protein